MIMLFSVAGGQGTVVYGMEVMDGMEVMVMM